MEETELSDKARNEQAALEASTEKRRLGNLRLESNIEALEEIVRRKQEMIRRQKDFLALMAAEREVLDADYRRICEATTGR